MADISTSTTDPNGIAHLINNDIVDLKYIDLTTSTFANPGPNYTGYAADGYWYESGVADPSKSYFKSSWATEGEHTTATSNRGLLDRFPDRILLVTTPEEVVILDADDLSVWMRCVTSATSVGMGNHTFLSWTSKPVLVASSFSEGVLIVATSEYGVRIADFRFDVAYRLAESNFWLSMNPVLDGATNGLVGRNAAGFWLHNHFSDTTVAGYDDRPRLTHNQCISVTSGTFAKKASGVRPPTGDLSGGVDFTVPRAVVGHWKGMTVIEFRPTVPRPADAETDAPPARGPLVDGYTTFRTSADDSQGFIRKETTDWKVVDDGDGDTTTPTITNISGDPDYDGGDRPVRPGDLISLPGASTTPTHPSGLFEITGVSSGYLQVLPELGLDEAGSGGEYKIYRSVPAAKISREGYLYFCQGQTRIVRADEDWLPGGSAGPGFHSSSNYAKIGKGRYVSDMMLLGEDNDVYVSNSEGVVFASTSDIESEGNAELRYSVRGGEGKYKILAGGGAEDRQCHAVVADVETGHILVSSGDSSPAVTEIDLSIQHAFRDFDSTSTPAVTSKVKSLVSFRNPEGPPDKEIS